MNLDSFIEECRVPLLAAVDCGMTGAIVMNDSSGIVSAFKMPVVGKGIDLYAIAELLKGRDLVLMEKPPMGGFAGKTRMTENTCFNQFKELYGLFCGAQIPFHCVSPKAWQSYLELPKKKEVGDDVWKQFLMSQAVQRFPKQKVTLYASDAWLLYDVARKIWPIPKNLWP